MPYGCNAAHCHACGIDYLCGDCITQTCSECRDKGHTDCNCPICKKERALLFAEILKDIRTKKIDNCFSLNSEE